MLATVSLVDAIVHHAAIGFALQIALWLWATVLFANFAESVAEGRGKAAADSLRAARVDHQGQADHRPKPPATHRPDAGARADARRCWSWSRRAT